MSDDFDVSIFFTELKTRHSLLTKHKAFIDKPNMKSNSNKLTGWLNGTTENPVQVEEDVDSVNIREESDEEDNTFTGIASDAGDGEGGSRKRSRDDSEDELFIGHSDISDDEGFQTGAGPGLKRRRLAEVMNEGDGDDDDKKKLGVDTSYDGFSIYGRILCLLVKRRGNKANGKLPGSSADETGQQMLEGWISTQAAAEQIIDND